MRGGFGRTARWGLPNLHPIPFQIENPSSSETEGDRALEVQNRRELFDVLALCLGPLTEGRRASLPVRPGLLANRADTDVSSQADLGHRSKLVSDVAPGQCTFVACGLSVF